MALRPLHPLHLTISVFIGARIQFPPRRHLLIVMSHVSQFQVRLLSELNQVAAVIDNYGHDWHLAAESPSTLSWFHCRFDDCLMFELVIGSILGWKSINRNEFWSGLKGWEIHHSMSAWIGGSELEFGGICLTFAGTEATEPPGGGRNAGRKCCRLAAVDLMWLIAHEAAAIWSWCDNRLRLLIGWLICSNQDSYIKFAASKLVLIVIGTWIYLIFQVMINGCGPDESMDELRIIRNGQGSRRAFLKNPIRGISTEKDRDAIEMNRCWRWGAVRSNHHHIIGTARAEFERLTGMGRAIGGQWPVGNVADEPASHRHRN